MWAKEWDNIFSKNEWGKYPSEHLVRFFKRNFKKKKIKDIGDRQWNRSKFMVFL